MPELVIARASGHVERHTLDDLAFVRWNAADVSAMVASMCHSVQPSGGCRVEARWLLDGRAELQAFGDLGAARLDGIPVEAGAVEQALEGLAESGWPIREAVP